MIKRIIKGFTIIEAIIYIIIFSLITVFLIRHDARVDEEQNNRKIGRQINDIASAIDKRISIEGKNISNWKNGTSWNGPDRFREFLRQELIGASNDTCGVANGWNPNLDLNGLPPTSAEGARLEELEKEAKNGKLVPCTLWSIYPYNLSPSLKINANPTTNEISSINMTFKFVNNTDFDKYFRLFALAFKIAKEQDSNEVLISKKFNYVNTQTGNTVDTNGCLNLKQNCGLRLTMNLGLEDSKDDKFKVDSSNSFKTNLGFANGTNFNASSDTNNILNCNIWTYESTTNSWKANTVECGITGGTKGYKEVNLIGSGLDSDSITIKGACSTFDTDLSKMDANCGLYKNNSLVQINTNKLEAKNLTSSKIYTTLFNTNNLSVKEDSSVSNTMSTLGSEVKSQEPATSAYTPLNPYDMKGLSSVYLPTIAENSLNTDSFSTKILKVNTETNLSDYLTATVISANKTHINNTATVNKTNIYNEGTVGTTTDGQLNNLATGSVAPIAKVKNSVNVEAKTITKNINIQNNLLLSSQTNPVSISSGRGIIAGDIDASNYTVNATNSLITEQFRFGNYFKNPNSDLTIAKSISFDGLGSEYIITNNAISSWGSPRFVSNAGISAKTINISGNLVLNSNAPYFYPVLGGEAGVALTTPIGTYTHGMDVVNPDGAPFFSITPYGRLFIAPYYDSTSPTSGVRIGSLYFFGRSMAQVPGDRPIVQNLTSLVYDYKAGDVLPLSKIDYYRNTMNNLTVTAPYGMYLQDGAYLHSNGGYPKSMNGNTLMPIFRAQESYVDWSTTENRTLSQETVDVQYLSERTQLVYNTFLEINRRSTIIGQVGDRGERGDTGAAGERGESGVQGIPGLVGPRGGE